jgi:hypothetical protein
MTNRAVPRLWIGLLASACALVIIMSVILVAAPPLGQMGFNALLFGQSHSPRNFSPNAIHYITFVYGILGSVMIGWMVALLFIIFGPFARGERWAWTAVATSASAWFAIDSAFSWQMGFPANIVLNVTCYLAFAIPLIGSYWSFWFTSR